MGGFSGPTTEYLGRKTGIPYLGRFPVDDFRKSINCARELKRKGIESIAVNDKQKILIKIEARNKHLRPSGYEVVEVFLISGTEEDRVMFYDDDNFDRLGTWVYKPGEWCEALRNFLK